MRTALLMMVAVLWLELGAASVHGATVEPGADAWVITADIAPFSLRKASLLNGGAGLYEGFLADDPQNVSAGAAYSDDSRGMSAHVGVTQQNDPTYVDHFLEGRFRDSRTGRLEPETTLATISGQVVFFYCSPTASCKNRTYAWRSGPLLLVEIEAKAFVNVGAPGDSPDPRRVLCPEPTEVLAAYLQRYPSILVAFTDTDDRAKQWKRDRTGVKLLAAELALDRAAAAPDNLQAHALYDARAALNTWADLREVVFQGLGARRENEHIEALSKLPPDVQLQQLNAIRQEYRQWWNVHQNDPVVLPPP